MPELPPLPDDVRALVAVLFAVAVSTAALLRQNKLQKEMTKMATKLSEIAGFVNSVNATLEKVVAEVEALKIALTDVTLPADAQESLQRLAATAQALDDLNPDAEAPPAPPTDPEPAPPQE